NLSQIALGELHACAIIAGEVTCWGYNMDGEYGDGSSSPSVANYTPGARAMGISGATQLALGYNHTCALLGDGSVRCWGSGSYGQLGDGTNQKRPTPVSPVWNAY